MGGDGVQLASEDSDFVPVPGAGHHYVAAIQNKPGELRALREASAATWSQLTPMVEIVGPKKRPEAYRSQTVAGWIRRISNSIGQRPCFLDVLRLRPEHPTTTSRETSPVLSVIHAAARRRRMAFVPVLPVGEKYSGEHMRLVSEAAQRDGRGAALRYPIRRLALEPGATHTLVLGSALKDLGVDVAYADVLVDLGYLSGDEELHPEDVGEALEEVTAVGHWRRRSTRHIDALDARRGSG
jgi:Beta protein